MTRPVWPSPSARVGVPSARLLRAAGWGRPHLCALRSSVCGAGKGETAGRPSVPGARAAAPEGRTPQPAGDKRPAGEPGGAPNKARPGEARRPPSAGSPHRRGFPAPGSRPPLPLPCPAPRSPALARGGARRPELAVVLSARRGRARLPALPRLRPATLPAPAVSRQAPKIVCRLAGKGGDLGICVRSFERWASGAEEPGSCNLCTPRCPACMVRGLWVMTLLGLG